LFNRDWDVPAAGHPGMTQVLGDVMGIDDLDGW
jgi:hypothetical protein